MAETPVLRYPGSHVAERGGKPAVVMAQSGETLSYGELDAFAARLARLYRALGLQPGDHVAYCMETRLECLAVQWGAHYGGLYYTFISTRLLPAEVRYIVEDCDARVLIVSEATRELAQAALADLAQPPRLFTLGGGVNGVEPLAQALSAHEARVLDGALEGSEMLYSSGTTGRPKGVKPALTGKPLGSTAQIADLLRGGFGVNPDTVFFSALPFYHAAPMKWAQGVTVLGGTVVLAEKFNAAGALETMERHRVTHSLWVPTMFHRMLALPDDVKSRYDLSSHRVAVHAAAPCPVPTKQAMIDWWGPILAEFYSCTENIGTTMTDSSIWLKRPGTVGRPLYGKVHIVGDDGQELPAGQDGLIYFSGGYPFSYHKDPEKTKEAYNDAGWATVGDIGHLDEDGFLYLTDRKNNMIITGGVNVYPQEAENVLASHPKVYDAAVIGTPHDDLGEEVRAVVQLQPGISPDPVLAEELIAYCRDRISHIKCPRIVDFRDELPRDPNGKLYKRLLRDEYRMKLDPDKG